MPPSRRPQAIRDTSDMVDDNALHITPEQGAVFGERRIVLKESEAQALQEKAAEADWLRQQLAKQSSGLAVQGGGLIVEGFQFSPTGLIAPEEFSDEAWEQIGHLLFKLEGSLQWLIGDWLAYGNDIKWGDGPAFAEKFGRDYGTIRNYASLSRQIPLSFRNDKLTYTHHVVAANAKLESEQLEYAFAGAIHFDFSVSEFRKWIKLGMPEAGIPTENKTLTLPAYTSAPIPKPALGGLEKLAQRDPLTYKAKDRANLLAYAEQVRAWIDELVAKAEA